MAWPTDLDNFNNPTELDDLDTPGVEHDEQHANANDAIEAIQVELGLTPSGLHDSVADRLYAADIAAAMEVWS